MTTKQMLFSTLIIGCVTNMALAEKADIFTTYNVFPANAHEYENISSTDGILDHTKTCFVRNYIITKQIKRAEESFGEPVTRFGSLIKLMDDGNCQCLLISIKGNDETQLKDLLEMHREKFEDGTFAREHKNKNKPK